MKLPLLTCLMRSAFVLIMILHSCSEPEVKKDPDVPQKPVEPNPPLASCGTDLLDGYCDKVSYLPGETLNAYLHGRKEVPTCGLNIYSINEELVLTLPAGLAVQNFRRDDPSANGFGYNVTATFVIPESMRSGVYTIEKEIPFLVRPKEAVDVLVVYPSNTANAYAQSGGKNLYSASRPTSVSFHRPIPLQSFCVPCLRWLDKITSWSIGYVADSDLDDYSVLNNGKILAIIGHSEYWTRQARLNFDRFVSSGGHALILSGNTMWWQVRYKEDDLSQLVCYKSKDDPIENPLLKTYLWNDPELQYPIVPSIGADFDKGGYGLKSDAGWDGFKIVSSSSPLLEGTGLRVGDIVRCPTIEYDGAPILNFNEGIPMLDVDNMVMEKAELIGFDKGFRGVETYGTFLVMQKSGTSGIVVNTGSTDWCSANGMGGVSGEVIKRITLNSIRKLINDENVFSQ